MEAVAAANDTPIQIINNKIFRVDQHGVCITRNTAGCHICRTSDSDRAKGETLRTVAAEQWR